MTNYMPFFILENIKPETYRNIVCKYLQAGSPDLKETMINFVMLNTKPTANEIHKFLQDIWSLQEIGATEYDIIRKAYPVGLPGYGYYHRILNYIRTTFNSTSSPTNMLQCVAEKFGGVYWNSGGNTMIVSCLISDNNAIIVSEDYISYHQRLKGMSTDDLLYLGSDSNESEVFGEMLNLREPK